jgi:dolichyl-phosphate beta-glucosyltransferase
MLSIVIPAYNEKNKIKTTIKKTRNFLEDRDILFEIIVIDDGSVDNTRKICQDLEVKLNSQRKNKGKGYSVREGVQIAGGNYILFMDADLATSLSAIERFWQQRKKYDVIIGSRAVSGAEVKTSLWKHTMGRISNFFINLFCIGGIEDTQCGFKMFTRSAAKKIFDNQKINGFGFDFEILMLAKKYNFSIKELPISWSEPGSSSVGLIDYIKTLFELVKIKFYQLTNKY